MRHDDLPIASQPSTTKLNPKSRRRKIALASKIRLRVRVPPMRYTTKRRKWLIHANANPPGQLWPRAGLVRDFLCS